MSTDTDAASGAERFVFVALQVSDLCKSALVSGSSRSVLDTLRGSTISVVVTNCCRLELGTPSRSLSPSHHVTCGAGCPPSARHVIRSAEPSVKGPTIESSSAPSGDTIERCRGGTVGSGKETHALICVYTKKISKFTRFRKSYVLPFK